MNTFEQYEVWFVTGAQLLYGGDAVIAVDAHSNEMVKGLNDSGKLPVKVVYKGTVNSSKEVTATFKAANNDDKCIGVITWMHTFSPAKMWIHGLQELKKPLLHFHTQFNKEIPWETMESYQLHIPIFYAIVHHLHIVACPTGPHPFATRSAVLGFCRNTFQHRLNDRPCPFFRQYAS